MPAKRPSRSPKVSRDNLKSNDEIANEVLAGRWGPNGDDRKNRLEDEGYDYDAVQLAVNRRIGSGAPAAYRSSITEVAKQVADGHYGEMPEQRRLIEGAGWNFAAVQAEVKRLSR